MLYYQRTRTMDISVDGFKNSVPHLSLYGGRKECKKNIRKFSNDIY